MCAPDANLILTRYIMNLAMNREMNTRDVVFQWDNNPKTKNNNQHASGSQNTVLNNSIMSSQCQALKRHE